MTNEPKQVIVMRKDLNMRKGKMIAQGAHASLSAILREGQLQDDDSLTAWFESSFTKICVSVDSEKELLDIYNQAADSGLLCSLIKDAGKTEFHGVPTLTCVCVGPGPRAAVDKITGNLPLL